MTQIPKEEVPKDISDSLYRWDCFSYRLRITQVALGVVGTASALAVTAFAENLGTIWVKVFSFLAAFCIGILAAFDIGGKANATRRAWRHLNTAILRYRSVPTSTLDSLIDSYSQAEEMVGGVNFRQPETNHKT